MLTYYSVLFQNLEHALYIVDVLVKNHTYKVNTAGKYLSWTIEVVTFYTSDNDVSDFELESVILQVLFILVWFVEIIMRDESRYAPSFLSPITFSTPTEYFIIPIHWCTTDLN